MSLNYEDFTTQAYVDWLIQSNKEVSGFDDLSAFTDTYGFGLIEEVFEVKLASAGRSSQSEIDLEIGDVVAYGTLLLSLLNTNDVVATRLDNLRRNMNYSYLEPAQTFAGLMKRIVRGDFRLVEARVDFEASVGALMSYALSYNSLSVKDICWLNYQKLLSRYNQGHLSAH